MKAAQSLHRIWRACALFLIVPLFWPTAAAGHELCPPRDEQLAYLASKYLEVPVGVGVANGSSLIELLTSEKGTWTIIETLPNGTSCIRAFGQGWRNMKPVGSERTTQ